MSQTSLKLTMIGPSGTGKSCYLYATYFRMLEGVAGFNFNCKDYNQARELASAWEVVLGDGVWPPGTDSSEEYRFACMKDGARIGEFSWLDYRGGLLNETGGNQKEVDDFLARACSSDAILACVPADAILATRSESGKRNNQWGRIKVGLLGALAAIYQTTSLPSLIFLVTKSDLCKSPEDGRYCVETIRSTFAQYFSGKPKYAMVAATRMGRFSDDVVAFGQGEKIDGVVDPTNVHLPILFPFWKKAKDEQKEIVGRARGKRTVAERAYNEALTQLEAARVEKEKAEEIVKKPKNNLLLALSLIVAIVSGVMLLYGSYTELEALVLIAFVTGSFACLSFILCLGKKDYEKQMYEKRKGTFDEKQNLADAALQEWERAKNALEAVETGGSATAALADAIWRELDGRVDLYEDGKRILNASGVEG